MVDADAFFGHSYQGPDSLRSSVLADRMFNNVPFPEFPMSDIPVEHYLGQMEFKLYNPEAGSFRDKLQDFVERGYLVACAPRSLGGEFTWEGPYLCGLFWSANLKTDVQVIEHWCRYGGTIVNLTDNAELVEMAKARHLEKLKAFPGIKTWEQVEARIGVDRTMASFPDLPYRSES